MIPLHYVTSLSYLCLAISLGLVVGAIVAGMVASALYTIVWNALLLAAACRDTTTQEVIS